MARTKRSAKLDSRNARLKPNVKAGRMHQEPIAPGRYLAYRRPEKGGAGSWYARMNVEGKILQGRLGTADDFLEADGDDILTYAQAQDEAGKWFKNQDEAARLEAHGGVVNRGPFTVADAIQAYLEHADSIEKKTAKDSRCRARVHIIPSLGALKVEKLTRRTVEQWRDALASSPAKVKGRKGEGPRDGEAAATPDERRARKSSANRVLTILKAALTYARDRGLVTCADDAWALVKPFRGVEEARQEYLTPEQQQRLLNSIPDVEFKRLVQGALLTGCRYGELCRLVCGDFDASGAGSLLIREAKGGKPRRVLLTSQGRSFFQSITAGRPADAPIFTRSGIKRRVRTAKHEEATWGPSEQLRLMREACKTAGLPLMGFHQLRHSYASALVSAGMPLAMVAKLTGHADARMLERHYAHLAPSDLSKALEALAPKLELDMRDVKPLKIKQG